MFYSFGLGLAPDEWSGGNCVNKHYLHIAVVCDFVAKLDSSWEVLYEQIHRASSWNFPEVFL